MMHFTAAAILALASIAHSIPTSSSSSAISLTNRQETKNTSTESEPNPIANDYPYSITGTINGTLAVVPISLSLARSLIPAQYNILTKAYKCLLPGFPRDSYPLIVRTTLDHDIQLAAYGLHLADFQLVKLMFPFVDLLSDGYSSFTWSNNTLVTADSQVAQQGIADYGSTPVPATYDPNLEAYTGTSDDGDEIAFSAYVDEALTFRADFENSLEWPYSLAFYKNVTNQPIFGNGSSCDQQINYWNTTLTTAPGNEPASIKGTLDIKSPLLPTETVFDDVYGVKVDVAFLENNYLSCASLKGYSFE